MKALMVLAAAALMTILSPKITYASYENLPSCSMASEGIFNGHWVKHRIVVAEAVVAGANDMGAILSELESLRDQGLCR